MRKHSTHYRKLMIDGASWSWRCTGGYVIIRNAVNKRHSVDLSTFTGWTWHNIERAYHKGYADGLDIRPGTVVDYIKKNLVGKDYPTQALRFHEQPGFVWPNFAKPIVAEPQSWEPALI